VADVFGGYGGNVIGGLITGVGLALSGACPGVIAAQVRRLDSPFFYIFSKYTCFSSFYLSNRFFGSEYSGY